MKHVWIILILVCISAKGYAQEASSEISSGSSRMLEISARIDTHLVLSEVTGGKSQCPKRVEIKTQSKRMPFRALIEKCMRHYSSKRIKVNRAPNGQSEIFQNIAQQRTSPVRRNHSKHQRCRFVLSTPLSPRLITSHWPQTSVS